MCVCVGLEFYEILGFCDVAVSGQQNRFQNVIIREYPTKSKV